MNQSHKFRVGWGIRQIYLDKEIEAISSTKLKNEGIEIEI